MAQLFPLFLKLEGRKVLVVGAGEIASQKLAGLIAAGAVITVVAPAANNLVTDLASSGQISWIQRDFTPSDLDGVALVIAATSDTGLNGEIFREAESRNMLCNAVDDPDHCHFFYPAVVRRGDLQIAISTAGHSPALAQRIRSDLEHQFGPAYGAWLTWLGRVRKLYFDRPLSPHARKSALHSIATQRVFQRFESAHARKLEGAR